MSATSNLLLQWSAREPRKNLNIWIHRRKHCLIPGKGIRLTLYCSKFLSGEVGGGGERVVVFYLLNESMQELS